jgi:DNA invertase Pin-like site-specific DNA recombinase
MGHLLTEVLPYPNNILQQITGDPVEQTGEHPRNGVGVEVLKERLTLEPGREDPMAAFQLNMMGAFARFERELIRRHRRRGEARRLQGPAPQPRERPL